MKNPINSMLKKTSIPAIKTKTFMLVILLFFFFTGFAQDKNTAELKVKTSAVCEMCKTTIEKHLAFERGIKKSTLDVPSKIVTVTYNPDKTTPEKIRQSIAKAGYDADDVPANPKAYKKLDACCKKGAVCNDKTN